MRGRRSVPFRTTSTTGRAFAWRTPRERERRRPASLGIRGSQAVNLHQGVEARHSRIALVVRSRTSNNDVELLTGSGSKPAAPPTGSAPVGERRLVDSDPCHAPARSSSTRFVVIGGLPATSSSSMSTSVEHGVVPLQLTLACEEQRLDRHQRGQAGHADARVRRPRFGQPTWRASRRRGSSSRRSPARPMRTRRPRRRGGEIDDLLVVDARYGPLSDRPARSRTRSRAARSPCTIVPGRAIRVQHADTVDVVRVVRLFRPAGPWA